jgi:alpha-ribazole phosphatase
VKLWLVRHAAPAIESGRCWGRTDLLADAGATVRAAAALAQALPPGTALHCSPLQRCLQLARELQALRPDLSCRTDARLAEMDCVGMARRAGAVR